MRWGMDGRVIQDHFPGLGRYVYNLARALADLAPQDELILLYDPAARNGPYMGLMQILPETARTMGHRGPPESLLDPETNLRYAGRYLRGAWILSGGNADGAVRRYASGYYYEARDRCLLVETGLRDREVRRGCS